MIIYNGPVEKCNPGIWDYTTFEAWTKFTLESNFKQAFANTLRDQKSARIGLLSEAEYPINWFLYVEKNNLYDSTTFDCSDKEIGFVVSTPQDNFKITFTIWRYLHEKETAKMLMASRELISNLVLLFSYKRTKNENSDLEQVAREGLLIQNDKFKPFFGNVYLQNLLTPYFVLADEPLPYTYYKQGTMFVVGMKNNQFFSEGLLNPNNAIVKNLESALAISYWVEDTKQAMQIKLKSNAKIMSRTFE